MIGRGGLGTGFQRCKPVGLCELLGVCLRRSEIVYDRLKNLGKMIPKLLCAESGGWARAAVARASLART